MGFQLVRNKYIVLYYIMSKSSEKVVINENSPGREPLNPTGKISPNIPNNKPQHPKPPYIYFFAKKNRKNHPQGIGPFRVDTTKKANTVKRTSPTRKTTYRGVNAFSFKNVHPLTHSPIVSKHITLGEQTTHINPVITRNNHGTPFVYKSATGNNPSNENNKKTTRSLSNSKTRKKTLIKTSIKRRAKSI